MKDVTVEKAESLVDQIQEVQEGGVGWGMGWAGLVQESYRTHLALLWSIFPKLDLKLCDQLSARGSYL
jgi:hypothetical protein